MLKNKLDSKIKIYKFDNLMLIWIYWNKWNKESSITINQDNLSNWKIKKQSYFRFQNIFSLEKSLIERKVTSLETSSLKKVNEKLKSFIDIS